MSSEEAPEDLPRISVKDTFKVIPPPSALRERRERQREKRVRVRRIENLGGERALVNPQLARELEISESIEIVVAGRKSMVLEVAVDDKVPPNEIWADSELLRNAGIADNSIATVRRSLRR